jgi:hypothetical protein
LVPFDASVTDSRLRLRLPQQCPECGAGGSVTLHQTVKRESLLLAWTCLRCDADWPVRDDAPQVDDRRSGPPERRRNPRTDRRKRR